MNADPNQTTIEAKAKAMYDSFAKPRSLPSWEECDSDIRSAWREVVKQMDRIGEDITYDE